MNVRYDIKCSVCKFTFITKVQLGYVENANIRFGCPNCNSLIKGIIYQKAPDYNITFENAEIIDRVSEKPAVIISLSTELPILKKIANSKNDLGFSLSPFIALTGIIPMDTFRNRYLEFRDYRKDKILHLESIVELAQNKQWIFAIKEAKKHFSPESSYETQNFENLSFYLISLITRKFIQMTIPNNYENSYTIRFLYKATLTRIQKNKSTLIELKSEFEKYINIEREFVNALKIAINFIKNIESYLPVIALSYGKGFNAEFKNEFLITTFSFEELRDIYKDSFELLARISLIYIGFSNYIRNNNPNDFSDISRIPDLTSYYKLNNGNKKDILVKIPLLKKYFRSILDNKLRNAIGHNKTEYYSVEQLIKYYPFSDITKKDTYEKKSLVDFAYQTYLMNLCVIDFVSFIGKWYHRMDSI